MDAPPTEPPGDPGSPSWPDVPTIYDVAKACGVAPSTVSRAFSRPGRVKAETAERIRATAAAMGYQANPLARALPTGRSSLLALVVADVTNPFFFDIIRGAEQAATSAGYTLLVADVHESAEAERTAVDRIISLVEGLALATTRMSNSSIRVAAKQRPTVVLNRVLPDVPSLVTDNAGGIEQAVEHLVALGHRSITYLAGPEASWADGMRWRALLKSAEQRSTPVKVRRLGPFPPTQAGGFTAAESYTPSPGSAVIAYNDLMAIGFMRGLARRGVDVPGDVSVVGFDNIFGSDLCSPQLTTVGSPLRHLGTMAVELLLAAIRSRSADSGQAPAPPVRPSLLPTQLIVRASTAPAAG